MKIRSGGASITSIPSVLFQGGNQLLFTLQDPAGFGLVLCQLFSAGRQLPTQRVYLCYTTHLFESSMWDALCCWRSWSNIAWASPKRSCRAIPGNTAAHQVESTLHRVRGTSQKSQQHEL
ncbi:hypothetical protein E2C01_040904 [Portunus trituberculatus]|uniref:Uncharacterized protein n=1 Tax=Portunus trituberculatus TaxID=210409 RepID=A0A5B7FPH1_PORTR|nr:hypothetical protein [Portunus trituberculatus]